MWVLARRTVLVANVSAIKRTVHFPDLILIIMKI